jgi:hypothetical protein
MVVALLALVPGVAAAQYNPFDRDDGPALIQNFTGGTVRMEREFQADLYILDAFNGRQRVDRFDRAKIERPEAWKFYGRLGPMHFQNRIEPRPQGFQFSWRGTGPNLGGRIYLGIHRSF